MSLDIECAAPAWKTQRRRHQPIEENGRFSNPFAKASAEAETGRRHFPPRLSDSYVPRRMMKEVYQNLAEESRPEGTRKVPQPDRSQESTRPNRRHYRGKTNNKNDHFDNRTEATWEHQHIQSKARAFCDEGMRACEQPATEMSMEKTMNRKQRVTSLQQQRNGVPLMHMGDHHFSNPEYSGGFWKQEGIAPSLTLRKRVPPVHHTKTLELDEEMLLWKAPRRATFEEKQKDLERRAEMNAVSMLPKARKQNASSKYSSLLASTKEPS